MAEVKGDDVLHLKNDNMPPPEIRVRVIGRNGKRSIVIKGNT